MKEELKCLDCDSTDLEYYKESLVTEFRAINKNNTISKRVFSTITDTNFPWGIRCGSCQTCFDYEEDDKGRVIKLKYK